MEKTKITKRQALEVAIKVLEEVDFNDKLSVLEVLDNEVTNLKNRANKEALKRQSKNNGDELLRQEIIEVLKVNGICNIKELQDHSENLKDLSSPKIVSLVKPLLADNVVVRKQQKGKVYYELNKEEV
jgi:phage FluMu protein gp41